MTYERAFTSVRNKIFYTVVIGSDPVHPITQGTGKIDSDVLDVKLNRILSIISTNIAYKIFRANGAKQYD